MEDKGDSVEAGWERECKALRAELAARDTEIEKLKKKVAQLQRHNIFYIPESYHLNNAVLIMRE